VCGISGFVSRTPETGLDSALEAIRHRGPDASGQWHHAAAGWYVGLGHVRLSIIDLSEAANQPFVAGDHRNVIVYNGEIYNFEELRAELGRLGRNFRTHSDTEVVLQAYQEWGTDCLRRFEGMFAFALFDLTRNSLLLARDPFGIKPLYYFYDAAAQRLLFGSELRALASLLGRSPEPDPDCFAEFLLNGFLYEPSTGFLDIRKVEPGAFVEFEIASGVMNIKRFDDPFRPVDPANLLDLERLLTESMRLQCVADVPLGLFFSGGTDSTALAVTSPRPLEALYVEYGAAGGDTDLEYARDVSSQLSLQMQTVQHKPEAEGAAAILASFNRVARGTEEPISDYTYIASELIAQVARSRGFKVMLSGMGGDELFAGYPRHLLARYRSAARAGRALISAAASLLASRSRWSKKADRLARFVCEADFVRAYTSLVGYFSTAEVDALLERQGAAARFNDRLARLIAPAADRSPLKRAMLLDRFGFLSHNLTVTDRSSMAHGVEVRVPLICRELADLGLGMADQDLIRNTHAKWPLKQVVARHLPHGLVHRPKVGFNPPLDGKIQVLGPERINTFLTEGPIANVVDSRLSRFMVEAHFSGQSNNTYKLWQLLYFNEWLRSHSEAASAS
jgi:asparagine synthase (glutamine-hydrolysing)